MQSRQSTGEAMFAGGDPTKAARRITPWSRDGLMHPTALPLGLAIGCCLGLVTAVIAFF